ncbi:SpoIIE family protein phosphatase [Streptomyces sp. NPDC000994]
MTLRLLLGIDPDADYPEIHIPLPPGAVLALYSDGVIQAPGIDFEDATAHLVAHDLHRRDFRQGQDPSPEETQTTADASLLAPTSAVG